MAKSPDKYVRVQTFTGAREKRALALVVDHGSSMGLKAKGPTRTLGLLLFLIYYFQYSKRTITQLLPIFLWEVTWFESCGRVFHG
jgi:hypothetical protein